MPSETQNGDPSTDGNTGTPLPDHAESPTSPNTDEQDPATDGSNPEQYSDPDDETIGIEQDVSSFTTAPGATRDVKTLLYDTITPATKRIPFYSTDPVARKISDEEINHIHEFVRSNLANNDGRLLRIKPSPDGQGITGAVEMFEDLSTQRQTERFGTRDVTPVQSFEIWMVDDQITFRIFAANDETEKALLRDLDSEYPEAEVDRVWDASTVNAFLKRQVTDGEYDSKRDVPLPDEHVPFPPLNDARHIAMQSFSMERERMYPLRKKGAAEDVDEVREKEDDRDEWNDPYNGITSKMIADHRNHFVLQIVFKPIGKNWVDPSWWALWRKSSDSVIEDLTENGSADNRLARRIDNRRNTEGYQISVHVIGIGTDKSVVERGVTGVAGSVNKRFAGKKQALQERTLTGREWFKGIGDAVVRRHHDNAYVSHDELGMLAHLPNDDVNSSIIVWSRGTSGNDIPADAPRFGSEITSPFPANRKPLRYPSDPSRFDVEPEATTSAAQSTGADQEFSDINPGESSEPADTGEERGSEGSVDHQNTETATDGGGSGEQLLAQYPDWLQTKLKDAEEVEYCENQSKWVSAKRYFTGISAAGIGAVGVLWSIVALFNDSGEYPASALLSTFAVVLAAGAAMYGYERVRRSNRWYVITDSRVLVKTGILRKDVSKYPLQKIQNWEQKQSFLQRRWLGTGEVVLWTAGSGEEEIELTWVNGVPEFTGTLQEVHEEHTDEFYGDSTDDAGP